METGIPHDQVYSYLLSGNAEVTFYNTQTRNQITTRVKKSKHSGTFYVYTNTGLYMGYINSRNEFHFGGASTLSEAARRFQWVWKAVLSHTLPAYMLVMHSGVCGRCGRKLTDGDSLELGIGPECRKKVPILSQIQMNV